MLGLIIPTTEAGAKISVALRLGLASGLVAGLGFCAGAEPADEPFHFERQVRPILAKHCVQCHGPERQEAGVRFDSAEGNKGVGLDGYPVTKAEHPDAGLSQAQLETLSNWIEAGAAWPVYDLAAGQAQPTPQTNHWAFQPLSQPSIPEVRNAAWPRTSIDSFVLAKLEESGIVPAAEADPRTLIRRVYYDLTGLPPAPEDVDVFLADPSPNAYENVIERLLASPQYGERWGRHWLDLVRYTDSFDSRASVQTDPTEIWRYRDWVVKSLNEDMPYNQFLQYQIAGDLIPLPDGSFNRDGLIATGMLAIGNWPQGDADKQKMLTDIVDDQVDVVTRGFLGVTLACARCHDHKFDRFTTADYYGLAGMFFSSSILPGPGQKTEGSPILHLPLLSKTELAERKAREERLTALRGERDSLLLDERRIWGRNESAKTSRYILAAHSQWLGNSFSPDPELNEEALQRWARALGYACYPVLALVGTDILGLPGVHARRGKADTPSSVANTTDREVRYSTITQPARTVVVHPAPDGPAAVAWRSPVSASMKIRGRVADADLNCGDGVRWSLELRSMGKEKVLSEGVCANASESSFAIEQAQTLTRGALIEIHIFPNAEYSCDSTVVELQIISDNGETWDLASDVLLKYTEDNPWPDSAGNNGVWWLFDARNEPVLDQVLIAPWWADVGEMQDGLRDSGALEHGAAMIQAAIDHALSSADDSNGAALDALIGETGPFWVESPPAQEGSRRAAIETEIAAIEQTLAQPIEYAVGIQEGGVPDTEHAGIHDVQIHHRGDYSNLGDLVPRRMPAILITEGEPPIAQGSGRLELAQWLVTQAAPLAARVIVNRVWMLHFGEGLVRTPGDFGTRGEAPTHPELLDYLAREFIDSGWSIKSLHRAILQSAVYRQSCAADLAAIQKDPENRLLARMNRKRLEAEALRDSLLAVSRRLDLAMGGPAYKDFNTPRRTLYLRTVRSDRSTFTSLFDAADSTAIVPKRSESTVSPQALFLMNHPFVLAEAEALVKSVDMPAGVEGGPIIALYRRLFARAPNETELAVGRELLSEAPNSQQEALVLYAQVLLCSNEFMFVD